MHQTTVPVNDYVFQVSLEGEETPSHTFMVDFSMPLQQLHAIFCRYYGIRVSLRIFSCVPNVTT